MRRDCHAYNNCDNTLMMHSAMNSPGGCWQSHATLLNVVATLRFFPVLTRLFLAMWFDHLVGQSMEESMTFVMSRTSLRAICHAAKSSPMCHINRSTFVLIWCLLGKILFYFSDDSREEDA